LTHNNKVTRIHSVCGTEISEPHSLQCYIWARRILGTEIHFPRLFVPCYVSAHNGGDCEGLEISIRIHFVCVCVCARECVRVYVCVYMCIHVHLFLC